MLENSRCVIGGKRSYECIHVYTTIGAFFNPVVINQNENDLQRIAYFD